MSENPLLDIGELNTTPVSPATGISALAMNFAMKWYDITMIKDGAMYQQKKLEGANINLVDLSDVFETARQFEAWLVGAPERLATIITESGVLDLDAEDIIEENPDA